MKFTLKVFLFYFLFFIIYLTVAIFCKVSIYPISQHIECFKQANKKFIRTEQSADFIECDSIFMEKNLIRLHKNYHNSLDDIFNCERTGNSKCYISVKSLNITEDDSFIQKNIIEGNLPSSKQILINKNLADRMNLKIGDTVIYKNSIYDFKFGISGIIRDFYGFPEYKRNSTYFCCINQGSDYYKNIECSFYNFSDSNTDAFYSEEIADYILDLKKKNNHKIILLFFIELIFSSVFFFLLRNTLQLKKHYQYLFILGNSTSKIRKEIFKDIIFTSFILFILNLFTFILVKYFFVLEINLILTIICILINFIPEVINNEFIRNKK